MLFIVSFYSSFMCLNDGDLCMHRLANTFTSCFLTKGDFTISLFRQTPTPRIWSYEFPKLISWTICPSHLTKTKNLNFIFKNFYSKPALISHIDRICISQDGRSVVALTWKTESRVLISLWLWPVTGTDLSNNAIASRFWFPWFLIVVSVLRTFFRVDLLTPHSTFHLFQTALLILIWRKNGDEEKGSGRVIFLRKQFYSRLFDLWDMV